MYSRISYSYFARYFAPAIVAPRRSGEMAPPRPSPHGTGAVCHSQLSSAVLTFLLSRAGMANPMNQFVLPLGTFTDPGPHPSRGGNPYSDPRRQSIITMWQLGIPLESPQLELLRQTYDFPSYRSCLRYIKKYRTYGHWQPMRATGNHEAEREVRGQPLVCLALYRVVHPAAPISHVQAFLFNMDPTVAPYFQPQIIRAERLLGLRMKAASTTCFRAFWAINMHKRDVFWHWDYPFGRNNVLTRDKRHPGLTCASPPGRRGAQESL